MDTRKTTNMTLLELEQTLEIYGADFRKMPDHLAKDVKLLVKQSAKAKALYQEFAALDEMLNTAKPMPAFEIKQLEQNILSTLSHDLAENEETNQPSSSSVIAFSPDKNSQSIEPSKAVNHPSLHAENDNRQFQMIASGLIAASLLLGVFFGATGNATGLFEQSFTVSLASADMADDILYLDTDFNLGSSTFASE